MIKFLILGLLRDRSRSRLPVIVVAIGVMLTVFLHAYITGFMGDTIEMNARFAHGHVKVMTQAYADNAFQLPLDLAILNVSELEQTLKRDFPAFAWASRINFGGLADVPDENGETRAQGPFSGFAMDFLSAESNEAERLELERSLVQGHLIRQPGEALLSEAFAQKLNVIPGDEVTWIGSTMNGSMTLYNLKVAGTITFGVEALDRGSMLIDIEDAQIALDMPDAAGEVVGFLKTGYYEDESAKSVARIFNLRHESHKDEFAPVMKPLSEQGTMGQYVSMAEMWSVYLTAVFVLAMALVLWNAGLLGGLRRYGEFGIRLAMGEEKNHVYRTLIYESVIIGVAGTLIGTTVGLFFAFLVQQYGIDISGMMEGSSVMMPATIRTRITAVDFYIALIPGLISTVVGTMLAGIGIYKRKTAYLFKELEA